MTEYTGWDDYVYWKSLEGQIKKYELFQAWLDEMAEECLEIRDLIE